MIFLSLLYWTQEYPCDMSWPRKCRQKWLWLLHKSTALQIVNNVGFHCRVTNHPCWPRSEDFLGCGTCNAKTQMLQTNQDELVTFGFIDESRPICLDKMLFHGCSGSPNSFLICFHANLTILCTIYFCRSFLENKSDQLTTHTRFPLSHSIVNLVRAFTG